MYYIKLKRVLYNLKQYPRIISDLFGKFTNNPGISSLKTGIIPEPFYYVFPFPFLLYCHDIFSENPHGFIRITLWLCKVSQNFSFRNSLAFI